MTTIEKQRQKMGVTKVSLQNLLGISKKTLEKKLNGDLEFKQCEIAAIKQNWDTRDFFKNLNKEKE